MVIEYWLFLFITMNLKFQQLVKLFQRLPGVGPRQAARFVIALLDQPEENLVELGTAINRLKKEISFCGECFNISDNSHCHICHDTKRDKAKLMVVEKEVLRWQGRNGARTNGEAGMRWHSSG